MKKELQQILFDSFPDYFSERKPIDLKSGESFLPICFGIETGNGWFSIIRKLCIDIYSLYPSKDFKFHQIKEKFGGLRVYATCTTKEINDLIGAAENESFKTCEDCGTKKFMKQRGDGWIYTLCWFCYHKFILKRKIRDFKFTIWWRYKKLISKLKKIGNRK